MAEHEYSVEELMLDDSFKSYCLDGHTINSSHWQTIIKDHPEQAATFAEAKSLIVSLNGGLEKAEVNRQIEKLRRLLKERNKNEPEVALIYEPVLSDSYVVTGTGSVKRMARRRIISFAAAACLVGFMAYLFFPRHQNETDLKNQLATTSFHTGLGQRKTISLPDGSIAILNSNSSISFSNDFNKSKRDIDLKGTAFFTVAKNPGKPFIVSAGNITTTALGTQFFVHSSNDLQKGITVELLEGKVSVAFIDRKSAHSEVILYPGQKAESSDGINLKKNAFDSTYSRSWIDGLLVFDKTPATEAIKRLEDWYNVKIDATEKDLKGYLISGTYENEPLQDVLKVICFSTNKHFSVSGNAIKIE